MIGGVILCIGDSLTNGARAESNYPVLLGHALSEKYRQTWVGINKGINGETSQGLVNRVYDVMRSYSEAHEVIVTIGTNDAKDSVATALETYIANWQHIVNCARFLNKKLFVGTIPDLKGFGAPDYSIRCGERIASYNQFLLEQLATEFPIVDFRGIKESGYSDGVHLNFSGYQEMASRALKAIEGDRLHVSTAKIKAA